LRYIKDEPFIFLDGKPVKRFTDASDLSKSKNISVVDSVVEVVLQYQPSNQVTQLRGQVLDLQEIDPLNKAMAILEAPCSNGYYALEDTDFDVIVKVVGWVIPTLTLESLRNGSKLLGYLQKAPSELPNAR